MSIFLSIFVATCRPKNIKPFLDNLREMADDPSSFEVLFKLDEGATELVSIIEEYKKTSPLNIKYMETPTLDGYYSLDDGYNRLLKIADPDTYFCWLLTDEIRLETKGWDSILKKHIGFYPDDIFRIKLSIFQLKNYHDFFECLPCPDNYAVTTRKWLEITGGWGNFWGPDSWHQCVDYYLGLCKNKENPYGIWRSYPIFDIKVGGQEAGQGIEDPAKLKERAKKIWLGWQKHSTHEAQEDFYRLAQRLNAHIVASSMGIKQYVLRDNMQDKTVSLSKIDENYCIHHACYNLPKLTARLITGHKKIKIVHIFNFIAIYRHAIIRRYRMLIKIKDIINESTYKLIVFLLDSIYQFIRIICISITTTISFLLSLPVLVMKFIYRHVILKIVVLPKYITKPINIILCAPHYIAKNIYHGLLGVIKNMRKLFSHMKLAISNYPERFKRRKTSQDTRTYIYDGKHLLQKVNNI